MGEAMELNSDFTREILKKIHEESVRQQMIIMGDEK
jgi:chorismate mutase